MDIKTLKKAKLPDAPGVYFFKTGLKTLYIGKATSLKDRVRSYFSSDLIRTRGPLIVQMMEKASSIEFQKTDSVLEALILEAQLIKKHQPPFNTIEKDDKSYNYIVITKEDFPRVLLSRAKDLPVSFPPEMRKYLLGPFPHGSNLKDAMKIIRRIFPYRDTCEIGSKKPCFNAQIGLCPGVCSGSISKTEYNKEIKTLINFLEGKKTKVVKDLNSEMKVLSKEQKFERANILKKRIFALNHIQDITLLKRKIENKSDKTFRIEAYDVAHISGKDMVGVMVVVEDGLPNKAEYRKFKIRSVEKSNDPAALREILTRRLGHLSWNLPQLIVVDGNDVQKRVAEEVIKDRGFNINVVAVVKDERHRPKALIGNKIFVERRSKDILLANAEAHRFAVSYHRASRNRSFIP